MGAIYTDPIAVDPDYQAVGHDLLPSGVAAGTAFSSSWFDNPVPQALRAGALDNAQLGVFANQGGVKRQPPSDLSLLDPHEAEHTLSGLTGPARDAKASLLALDQRSAGTGFTRLPPATALLDPREAEQRYGLSGLKAPIREGEAALLAQWQQSRDERADILRRADGGLWAGAARLSAGFAAGALDPVNIAASFIPVVGELRYAQLADRFGVTAARFIKGGAEGAAGQAAIEPLRYGEMNRELQDYTAADSLVNIAFGSVLGGGLHAGFGKLGDLLGREAPGGEQPAGEQPKGEQPRARATSELTGAPAEIAAAPMAVREGAMRGAIAAVAEGRPVGVADALGAAYDQVRARPVGPADDPSVAITTDDLQKVLVERGPVQLTQGGELTIPGRGHGLGKVIIRHGELSTKAPALQVTRDDVLALPDVLNRYEPADVAGSPAEPRYARAFRVQRDGRTVIYGVSRFTKTDNQDRLVTIHVEAKPLGPMSKEKAGALPGSPGRIITPAGDTPGDLPIQPGQGRAAVPAGDNLGLQAALAKSARDAAAPRPDPEDAVAKAAIEVRVGENVGAAATRASPSGSAPGEAAKSPELIEAERALAETQTELQRAGLAQDTAAAAELAAGSDQVKLAERNAKALDAAASCLIGRA